MKIVDNIELDDSNEEFNYAIDFVKHTERLVFLTGKAGTGKTTFLKYLRETTTKNTVILAPTGVAAINAGGQTIHSFFQIRPSVYVPNDKRLRTRVDIDDEDNSTIYDHFKYFKERLDIIKGLELLIIDEISMVRCDLLDVIDRLLRVFRRRPNEAFGGVQVILIGDTFQLPPIADFDQWNILKPYYKSPFFFNSKVIEQNKPVYIELKKIYRQNEQEFIDLLNRIRVSQISSNELKLLNSKYIPNFTPIDNSNYITLATHNNLVDSTNLTKLAEIQGIIIQFEATIKGTFPENIMPTDYLLKLKDGAQIMFIKNDKAKRYYNGKIAKITKIHENNIIAEFSDGDDIVVEKQVWNNIKYTWNEKSKKIEEEIIGSFEQYPIKLAWAITVHKSQGLTFEKVIADLGAAFTSGQVYVALSRCTSFNGLVLKSKIDSSAIKTDPNVIEFAKNETPNTLIVQELKAGKAEYYYKKGREEIKVLNFPKAYENFVKALKFRNDIETSTFKKYFITTAKRLSSFKAKYYEIEGDLQSAHQDIEDLTKTIESLSDDLNKMQLEVKNYSNNQKQLNSKIADLSDEIHELQSKNKSLIGFNQRFEEANEKLRERNDLFFNEIKKLKDVIENKNAEITRLKNLKWYDKLLGKQ
jgi:predicted  nucleic acid-binding Zn-ribbon protein